MNMTHQFDWTNYYKELADILLKYKDNRSDLVQLVKTIYTNLEIALPTLEKDNKLVDIDPFTFYGLFNKSSLKLENRLSILTQISSLFGVKAKIPDSFDGVPVLNNQNAVYYKFIGERNANDIDDIWGLFESALLYSKNPTQDNKECLRKSFDLTISKKGNANSKITMGLYWIAPDFFLNLDHRNAWFIYDSKKIPDTLVHDLPKIEAKISFDKYLEIMDKLRKYLQSDSSTLKNFQELSLKAWQYSEEVNQASKEDKLIPQRGSIGDGLADEDVDTAHYWVYSPSENAEKWESFFNFGVMGIGWGAIGDLNQYSTKEDMKKAMQNEYHSQKSYKNDSFATWQFSKEMKPGDIIFVKKGLKQIIGKGIVTSDYYYDSSKDSRFVNFRDVNWIEKGNWASPVNLPLKTLTDITQYTDMVSKIANLFNQDIYSDIDYDIEETYPSYNSDKFLDEVYLSRENYNTLVGLIRKKKNIILQGAPGVGKTFVAKRLAYSMMGEKNQDRVMMVQFHQSYSYEDFIEGFRPSSNGLNFEIKKGCFYNFCKKATDDIDNEYFFIIDEINRGNISKIFGELFMLIEEDKRGNSLNLLYSDEKFFVPQNVYIIGTMNTADRSLAIMDYALRRRFSFYEMNPGFQSEGFDQYRKDLNNEKFNRLIGCVENLNAEISQDESLGEGFCIGHSYFCNIEIVTDQILSNIVEYDLIPLIKEYWFDESQKIKNWSNILRSAIK